MQIANSTEDGQLMANFKALWVTDQACNPNAYNNSFYSIHGVAPSGLETYYNVSPQTPIGLTFSVAKGSGTHFTVTYSAVGTSSFVNGPILTLGLNSASSNPVVNATFTGIFSGSTYSQIESNYQTQEARGGVCAAYVP
jgi:hypothetical protein